MKIVKIIYGIDSNSGSTLLSNLPFAYLSFPAYFYCSHFSKGIVYFNQPALFSVFNNKIIEN